MSGKFKMRKGIEVVKGLVQIGFVQVSQRGSHVKFQYGEHALVVPVHAEVAI